jgi:hypothetical protein
MPPLFNAIITEFGWRLSFRVGGLLSLFMIVPLAALVVHARPSDGDCSLMASGMQMAKRERKASKKKTKRWVCL